MANEAQPIQDWAIGQDPATKQYHYFDPTRYTWAEVPKELNIKSDAEAKQFLDGMKKFRAVEATSKGGDAIAVQQQPSPEQATAAAGVVGPTAGPVTPTSVQARQEASSKSLELLKEAGKTALITGASLAPELLATRPAMAAAIKAYPWLAKLLQAPITGTTAAAGTQAALGDVPGAVATEIMGTAGPAASSAIRRSRPIPLAEEQAALRSFTTDVQKQLGSRLPGETAGKKVPYQGRTITLPKNPDPTRPLSDQLFDTVRASNNAYDLKSPLLDLMRINQQLKDPGIGQVGDTAKIEAMLDPQNPGFTNGSMGFDEAHILRGSIKRKADSLLHGANQNAPLGHALNKIADQIEESITTKDPEYRKGLAATHRQESVSRIRTMMENADPLTEFRKMRAEGVLETAKGTQQRGGRDITATAFSKKELDSMEQMLNELDLMDKKFKGISSVGKFTRMKGAAIGAIAGAPLGHPWLGIHLGRETSNIVSDWLTNAEKRELFHKAAQKGLLDKPVFWVGMTAASRGAINMANKLFDEAPADTGMSVGPQ